MLCIKGDRRKVSSPCHKSIILKFLSQYPKQDCVHDQMVRLKRMPQKTTYWKAALRPSTETDQKKDNPVSATEPWVPPHEASNLCRKELALVLRALIWSVFLDTSRELSVKNKNSLENRIQRQMTPGKNQGLGRLGVHDQVDKSVVDHNKYFTFLKATCL